MPGSLYLFMEGRTSRILMVIFLKVLIIRTFPDKFGRHFFPSNSFLRRRRKKALLRVNDRGGGWRMCILALCRACVCVCVLCVCVFVCFVRTIRASMSSARTFANNYRRYGDSIADTP